ncbi:MAG: LytR/AlgR family response regulator transcription factor [Cytophagales bacterium]
MNKIRCMIVDDEPLAIEIMESYVDRIDQLELVKKCSNAIEAFSELQKSQVDVIFLDIQMPKLSGIDFLKTIKNPPKIVLTTAYREYALESYELEVFDYLLKPIPFERFLKVVSKLNQAVTSVNSNQTSIERVELENLVHAKDDLGLFIYVNVDKKMIKVNLDEVYYVESLKDYVKIKTKAPKDLITHMQIGVLEHKLQNHNFIRIHRSYLVNKAKIEFFTATDIGIAGLEIPIGRNYKNEVMRALQQDVGI